MESAVLVSDFRGSAKYRRSMAGVVVRRVISKVWEQALLTGLVAERSDQ
jgi:CO/xanthine dehydrogenase FAD-binding subunit